LHLTLIAKGSTVIIGGADFSFGRGVGIVRRVAFPQARRRIPRSAR
jgi:hypothetical protein